MEKNSFTFPAISVIIPLYNVEKFIGECLDNLTAQTFQNFEVIAVDDCSTDSSAAIVQSYESKLGGRLQLAKTKKNSGGCGVPRNVGLPFSRGEYIFFLDADDTITPTAFEELYTVAKNFDADVVQCERCYVIPENFWHDAEFRRQLEPTAPQETDFVTEPTLLTKSILGRLRRFSEKGCLWNIWAKLIRRDFIFHNGIKFADIFGEDIPFTICLICFAQKYVMAPSVFYNYCTKRKGSIMDSQAELSQRLHRQIKALKDGIRYLDEFFSDSEIFSHHPDRKYILFDVFAQEMLRYLDKIYSQVPASALDEFLRKEFSDGDNLALTSFIFNMANTQRLQLAQTQRRIAELETELKSK